MKKGISRKEFIRNMGLATLGVPGLGSFASGASADSNIHKAGPKAGSRKPRSWDTRRGSWIRKGDQKAGDIRLADSGAVCSIIVGQKEHSAVQQAAQFLREDLEKISGIQPVLTQASTADQPVIRLVTLGKDAIPAAIDVSDIEGQWEAHKIVTLAHTVWLIGADFRGTAFAAYTLAERLGVDPLYLWTGYRPEKQETLVLCRTDYTAASPTFKYRGFFHDDEDILPRPFEWSGYPLRIGDVDLLWYQKYFETALRLRMNMVAPYTRVHRRYEVQQCAGQWGLIYTSHHYDILLSNPFGFQRFNLAEKRHVEPVWNWFKNKAGMVKFWKGGVWENKDIPCIWPVGLRGTNDYGYPFPKDMSEEEQADVFNQVIDTQVQGVKDILPQDESPVYTFTLYTEMLNKYQADPAAFKLPEDVVIVWPDNNDGVMRGLPENLGKWKHGVYYHLAYYGMDLHKQGTHIVAPATITSEFKKIVEAGATEFMLVNVSEVRDYIMEARLLAEICWDAPAMLNKPDPATDYINWWCNEYFGPDGTADAASVYRQYYQVLDAPKKLWFAADVIWHQLDALVKKFQGAAFNRTDPQDIAALKQRDKAYHAIMDRFDKSASRMTASQQQFFFENTKLGLSFDWRPTQAALFLEQALNEKDPDQAWQYVHQAIQPLEQLELDILKAERPPFFKWYRESWIRGKLSALNVHRSFDLVRAFIASDGTASRPPKRNGHDNIVQSQAWTRFIEESERINDPLSRS